VAGHFQNAAKHAIESARPHIRLVIWIFKKRRVLNMEFDELINKIDEIISWLPQSPGKGPPLPRRFNVLWSKPEPEKPEDTPNVFSVPQVTVRKVNVKRKNVRRKRQK
jgi:hypothetical protein